MTPEKLEQLKHDIILTRRLLIFISSPFGGFEKERTIFMTEFFPKLRETCSQRGIAMEVAVEIGRHAALGVRVQVGAHVAPKVIEADVAWAPVGRGRVV